jgi:orotate phosphoribosyltransferase
MEYIGMKRTQKRWVNKFEMCDALWIHNGSDRPHAILTSGLHSNIFFNSKLVISDDDILSKAAVDLMSKLSEHTLQTVTMVVGPATGATKLAQFLSEMISKQTNRKVDWASPDKSGNDTNKSMVFKPEDLLRVKGQSVLLCEDVVTTGGSADLTAKALRMAGTKKIFPIVACLVNRSGNDHVCARQIVSLIEISVQTWKEEDCPLCKQGSEAIRPKDNWAKLTGKLI